MNSDRVLLLSSRSRKMPAEIKFSMISGSLLRNLFVALCACVTVAYCALLDTNHDAFPFLNYGAHKKRYYAPTYVPHGKYGPLGKYGHRSAFYLRSIPAYDYLDGYRALAQSPPIKAPYEGVVVHPPSPTYVYEEPAPPPVYIDAGHVPPPPSIYGYEPLPLVPPPPPPPPLYSPPIYTKFTYPAHNVRK